MGQRDSIYMFSHSIAYHCFELGKTLEDFGEESSGVLSMTPT